MRIHIFLSVCLFIITSANQVSAQVTKPYPIPSFNVTVTDPAAFQETGPAATRAKRIMNVQVKPKSIADTGSCGATIYIYSLDHETILGPYYVNCGETLTVPIDEREWGVVVTADVPVEVSVWIEETLENNYSFL